MKAAHTDRTSPVFFSITLCCQSRVFVSLQQISLATPVTLATPRSHGNAAEPCRRAPEAPGPRPSAEACPTTEIHRVFRAWSFHTGCVTRCVTAQVNGRCVASASRAPAAMQRPLGVFTLGDARSFFWADVKNFTFGFNVKF